MDIRFDYEDTTKHYSIDDRTAYTGSCLCAATGILFFIPLVSAADSRYGRFWANQGINVLLVEIACLIVGLFTKLITWLLSLIPVIGIVFNWLYALILVVLWGIVIFYIAFGIYYVAKKKAKKVPFVGFIHFL